ncbi:uncharacterized protein LOC131847931 [Achroia grisella]|uniref:uncharacterized protein LOC131847931 n=1 Tax=Achroia grisella TaxID=688607 RepID=UPI0027D323FB|nr:uncharacterized protein LOC131847931 [Achroia grisella]XP_059053637.1 uncharacterized protein LOC131847931 [Achroia grisella]
MTLSKMKTQNKEELKARKRIAERLRYQRIINDPIKREQLKEKERRNYQRKKEMRIQSLIKDNYYEEEDATNTGDRQIATMIVTNYGKHLLMFNQYVYCKHCNQKQGVRWKCTRNASRGCNAYVIVSSAGIIVKANGVHTHDPPKYHRHNDGTYIRLY